jgi:hypothetical protein
VRQLLVAHPDFADDIEIRPVGLEHEKFPHLNCWLKDNVGDVEIVSNHVLDRIISVETVQWLLYFMFLFALTNDRTGRCFSAARNDAFGT